MTKNVSQEKYLEAIKFVLKKIDENLEKYGCDTFPGSASVNNVYEFSKVNSDWTNSFWTGMLWLAYEVSGDSKYRSAAETQLVSFKKRIEERFNTNHHDLGFLYTLSCVAAYKLTGSEGAKKTALTAADVLTERYCSKAGILQAWGDLSDPDQSGRMIIDCNMNLPLLYWASSVTGDEKYADIAKSHVSKAAKYIIRDDFSTYHTFYMDVKTGAPRFGKTAQGYSDDSCWARGQAWGIYGFPLSYIYTKDYSLLEKTKGVTDYFINHLPKDYVCYWDLCFTDGDEERDSSAAAIAACGMLELIKHLPKEDSDREKYEAAAVKIVDSLIDNYTTKTDKNSNGILLHAVYNKPGNVGVDECNIWGDYYYFEALVRLTRDWQLYW